jgi:hypothetical protein
MRSVLHSLLNDPIPFKIYFDYRVARFLSGVGESSF